MQGCKQMHYQSSKAEAPSSVSASLNAGPDQIPKQAGSAAIVRGTTGQTSQHTQSSNTAVRGTLRQTSQHAQSSASAVRGNAGQTRPHTQSSTPAAVAGQGGVLAPRSKADEEHHLALALSASMGEPLTGCCSFWSPRSRNCA